MPRTIADPSPSSSPSAIEPSLYVSILVDAVELRGPVDWFKMRDLHYSETDDYTLEHADAIIIESSPIVRFGTGAIEHVTSNSPRWHAACNRMMFPMWYTQREADTALQYYMFGEKKY